MKRRTFTIGCGIFLMISLIPGSRFDSRGQSKGRSQARPSIPPPAALTPDDHFGRLFLDTNSWVIFDREGLPVDTDANSPEAIQDRFVAHLGATNPNEYERSFPPNAERRSAIAAELRAQLKPRGLQERLSEIRDAVELARWNAAIKAIGKPVPVTDEMINRAIENDPKGPWGKVFGRR